VQFKVNLASPGRFHMFDLAVQLDRLNVLNKLYTGYPRCKIKQLPKDKIISFPWLMTPYMASARMGWHGMRKRLEKVTVLSFDQWLMRSIDPIDVFHSLSGFSTNTLDVVKSRYGSITVCDRGSCHILYQKEILEEEFKKWHCSFYFDDWIIDRELYEYSHYDYIALPSTFAYNTFLSRGFSPNKLVKIPYGVDISIFRPLPKRDNIFRVLYVGNIALGKGVPYLLDAVSNINVRNFEVCLVGGFSPEIRPILKKYSRNFKYLGYKSRNQLAEIYSQGSVLIIPSLQEGLALVQAQALACGLPVIATYNSGAEDLYINNQEGFIINARDSKVIREKILFLYENPQEQERMAQASLKRVRTIGGWNDYGETWLRIYHQLLQENNRDQSLDPILINKTHSENTTI
jgi:alpha-maltose-1-phosphate synthase